NWLKLPLREPKPDQLENNRKILNNMKTIREIIKEVQPEMETTNGKDTAAKTNIKMADDNAPITGNYQLTKIENLKLFECNLAESLKTMTHNVRDHIVMKLQQAGLTSLMNFYNITEYTWLECGSESQIDDFWVSRDMLVLLTEPKLASAENITDSDYKIVSTELKVEKRNLAAKIIDNTATLNTIWNTWDNLVKAEANKHIPFTYSAQKTFHSHTFKATNIHRGLTLVNKILKCIKSPDGPITLCQVTITINKLIAKIVKLTQLKIEELAPDDLCTANYSCSLKTQDRGHLSQPGDTLREELWKTTWKEQY
ncbi:22898_t:CDS:2, partial [Gigaspora margarita]